jgi:hypothetical protein
MDDPMMSLGMTSPGSVFRAAIARGRLAFVALCVALSLPPAAALAGGTPPEDAAFQAQRPAQPAGPKASPLGSVQVPAQAPAQAQPEQSAVFALPPPPEGGVKTADQARLRLQDICMYRTVEADKPDDNHMPRCACYARTLAKSFSAEELSGFAAADEVPEGARDRADSIWQGCKGKRE